MIFQSSAWKNLDNGTRKQDEMERDDLNKLLNLWSLEELLVLNGLDEVDVLEILYEQGVLTEFGHNGYGDEGTTQEA